MARFLYRERIAKHLMSTCFAAWRENAAQKDNSGVVRREEYADMKFRCLSMSGEIAWLNSTRSRHGTLMRIVEDDDNDDDDDHAGEGIQLADDYVENAAVEKVGSETELHLCCYGKRGAHQGNSR